MLGIQTQSYALARDEGPAFWTVGVLARIKATGEQTGGAFALVDELCPPGYATPLHIHHAEDEAFYVLEGEVTIFCGDERLKAGAGTYAFGPRNVPHGFRVEGNEPARLLILATPSGFDQFLQDAGDPAAALTTPPNPSLDLEKVVAVGNKYQIEILGPLPE